MKKTLLIILMLFASLTLVSCKQNEEIEIEDVDAPQGIEIVNDETILENEEFPLKTCEDFYQSKIKSINDGLKEELKAVKDVYDSAVFDVKGNSVSYTYTFAKTCKVDLEELKNQDFDIIVENTKDAIEFECGTRPETVTFRYLKYSKELAFEITK